MCVCVDQLSPVILYSTDSRLPLQMSLCAVPICLVKCVSMNTDKQQCSSFVESVSPSLLIFEHSNIGGPENTKSLSVVFILR